MPLISLTLASSIVLLLTKLQVIPMARAPGMKNKRLLDFAYKKS